MNLSSLYTDKGKLYRKMKRFDEALDYHYRAYEAIGGNRNDLFNPELAANLPERVSNILNHIAYTYLEQYESTKAFDYLKEAKKFNNAALLILNEQELNWSNTNEEIRLLQKSGLHIESWYFNDAIRIRNYLYEITKEKKYLEDAFSWLEKSKLRIFNTYKINQQNSGRLSVVEEELARINQVIEKLKEEYLKDDNLYSAEIKEELQKLKTRRKIFIEAMPQIQIGYTLNEVSLSDIQQKLLTKDQTLLEYFYSDSVIITALVRFDTILLNIQRTPKDFVKTIEEYQNELAKSLPVKFKLIHFSHQIYQLLIAPLAQEMTDELVIIPDGPMFYLPFETLLTEEVKRFDSYAQLPYLIKNKRIHYGLSTQMLYEKKMQKSPVFDFDFLGFAPDYQGLSEEPLVDNWSNIDIQTSRSGFYPLENNVAEVKTIANEIFDGKKKKICVADKATRSVFQKSIGVETPRILHLALHAKADNTVGYRSYIVFSYQPDIFPNIRLFASDLRQSANSMAAEMVVLSGCETNLGKYVTGEGVISFNRVFSWLGARSFVSSLWSVDDEKTKNLMVNFYHQLKAGKTKDKAMQIAQQQLLDYPPCYWSGFVIYGDVRKLF